MAPPLNDEKTLPRLPLLDMDATARPRTPSGIATPKSAIISVPPDWSADNSPGGSGYPSRSSFDAEYASGHEKVLPGVASFPMSASSSSSSSANFWPTTTAHASTSRTRPPLNPTAESADPFDRSNPFDHRDSSSSSSGEEDFRDHMGQLDARQYRGHLHGDEGQGHARRQSVSLTMLPHQVRSATDPQLLAGIPVDAELSGAGHGDGFDFGGGGPEGIEAKPHLMPPAFNRTFSAPLPNRVGFLRHPLAASDSHLGLSAHPPRHNSTSTSFSALGHPLGNVPTSYTSPDLSTPGMTRSDSSYAPSDEMLETPIQTLSMELADSLQAAIQTLLHLSPPHLLDNAKEQYSGCTVQMPTTSLSALLTSMRSLNYFSANIQQIVHGGQGVGSADSGLLAAAANRKCEDFDIGELVQSVADLMSGQAAQSGVDLVLFHQDVGMKHISVNGDVEGLGYLLGHILRQILLVAHRGDTIEIGLQILPQSPSMTPRVTLPLSAADIDMSRSRESSGSGQRPPSPGRTLPTPPSGSPEGPLLCTFEIIHNIYQPPDAALLATPRAEQNPFTHLDEQLNLISPKLDTIVCRRLLQHQNASLRTDVLPSSPDGSGQPRKAYELTVLVPRGHPIIEPTILTNEEEAIRQPFTHVKLAREPTLEELSLFAESLRGKKVVLHASLTSIFARHLTSYLGAWGMDVSHMPVEEDEGIERPLVARSATTLEPDISAGLASMSLDPSGDATSTAARFLIIDDDVNVLKRELLRIRADISLILKPRLSKRPTLLSRTRSSPLVRQQPTPTPASNLVLIHFTSLANYNNVRDVVAAHLGAAAPYGSGAFGYPEVMVIPKPVGPRRFLTALHTAVNQPVVDPHFSPIATSPRSPGGATFAGSVRTPSDAGGRDGFFDAIPEASSDAENAPLRVPSDGGSQKARSPLGEYPPTTRGLGSGSRSDRDLHVLMPTPGDITATPADEYFSNQGMRSGSSAGGSAVVMQSPDGRPFGMFFEPPVKADRRVSGSGSKIMPSSGGSVRKPIARKPTAVAGEEAELETPEVGSSPPRRPAPLPVAGIEGTPRVRRDSGKDGRTSSMSASSSGGIEGLTRRATMRKEGSDPATGEPQSQPIYAKGRARGETPVVRDRKARTSIGSAHPSPSTEVPPKVSTPGGRRKDAASKKEKEEQKAKDLVVPPINVLIVEDNPINQNILSMFLKKKKIKHQTAKDGEEAVRKWRTGGFHLILMDIQLPVKDGIEATREIRDLERNSNIGVFPMTPASETPPKSFPSISPPTTTTAVPPAINQLKSSVIIVALTASSLQTDRVNALAAGCNDFLTKPVSLKWLEQKIIEWGCMQALIDFDGWRRWKSADPKDPVNETKKGFQTGPQAAAKTLAGRLRIDRKTLRQSSTSSTASTVISEPTPVSASTKSDSPLPPHANPEIVLQTATPVPQEPLVPDVSGRSAEQAAAAGELAEARKELRGVAPDVITPIDLNEGADGKEAGLLVGEKPLPAIPPE